MAKSKSWIIESGEKDYKIVVDLHNFTGKHDVFLNGERQYYKSSLKQQLIGTQILVRIPNRTVYVEIQGNRVDCSVDGYFLDSKKEFKELNPFPWWGWIFVVACIAIPIATLGGAIPGVIGALGALYSAKSAVKTDNVLVNLLLSAISTALAWGLLILFIYLLSPYM